MIHVLFVDDDRRILQGLRRILRRRRREWEMHFVESGAAALEALAEGHFDVVVSDMRMPGMDGAALLTKTRDLHPHTARIVLSGHAELETVMRAIPVTHQYLSKPCEERLERVIQGVTETLALIPDPEMRRVIGVLGPLPASPVALENLSLALSAPDVSVGDLVRIARKDLAIATEVLRLANSGFFHSTKSATSIVEAMAYLGVDMLRSLAQSIPAYDGFNADQNLAGLLSGGENHHAFAVAQLASRLVPGDQADRTFTAALLHDVGELALAQALPTECDEVLQEAVRSGRPVHCVQQERIGFSHAEVGRFLFGLWGLPEGMLDVVSFHHRPRAAGEEGLGIVTAVHIADALCAEVADPNLPTPTLDEEYLAEVGLLDSIPEWRQMAREVVATEPAT